MNPYNKLPDRAFWRLGVSNKSLFDIEELWKPKFALKQDGNWVTFGSCFAQHLSAALVESGYKWCNFETAPSSVFTQVAREFNYGIFSARTGNIYTTTLLLQWVSWALGRTEIPGEIWEKDGRFYDPFRPAVEPNGFASAEEVRASQAVTLEAFARCIRESQYFVFTLGLTESWHNAAGGYEYPMCPGTAAGTFDAEQHVFRNLTYEKVRGALTEAIKLIREVNPKIRILLTVSPVPLTATNSGNHVLVATTYSKSVLRAVAGQLSEAMSHVDYFPSYEIISSPPFRATFFDPNLRTVNKRGVGLVMEHFFAGAEGGGARKTKPRAEVAAPPVSGDEDDAVVCEELLLDAFGGGR